MTMTVSNYEFYRQEHRVMHHLEVFRRLRDLRLGSFYAYYNTMADLIDNMVRRVLPLFL
jgi:hypothetical protein